MGEHESVDLKRAQERGNELIEQRYIDGAFEYEITRDTHDSLFDARQFFNTLRLALAQKARYTCVEYDAQENNGTWLFSSQDWDIHDNFLLSLTPHVNILDASQGLFEVTFDLVVRPDREFPLTALPPAVAEAFAPIRFKVSPQAIDFVREEERRKKDGLERKRLQWRKFLEFATLYSGQSLPWELWKENESFLDMLPGIRPERGEKWEIMERTNGRSGQRSWELVVLYPDGTVCDIYEFGDLQLP